MDFERNGDGEKLVPPEAQLGVVELKAHERAAIEFQCPTPLDFPHLSITVEYAVQKDLAERFGAWSGRVAAPVQVVK